MVKRKNKCILAHWLRVAVQTLVRALSTHPELLRRISLDVSILPRGDLKLRQPCPGTHTMEQGRGNWI